MIVPVPLPSEITAPVGDDKRRNSVSSNSGRASPTVATDTVLVDSPVANVSFVVDSGWKSTPDVAVPAAVLYDTADVRLRLPVRVTVKVTAPPSETRSSVTERNVFVGTKVVALSSSTIVPTAPESLIVAPT